MKYFLCDRHENDSADCHEQKIVLSHIGNGLVILVGKSGVDHRKKHSQKKIAEPVQEKEKNACIKESNQTAPIYVKELP